MFKKEDAIAVETVIAAGVKVEGDFISPGNVRIEGIVNGSVKADGNLFVTETAKIEADVRAENAMVAGEIVGNLAIADKLELSATAKVNGNITARVLSVEAGAGIAGNCAIAVEPAPIKNRVKNERPLEVEA
jgi:cytoskeletal protein CcmA (bactofilin family)